MTIVKKHHLHSALLAAAVLNSMLLTTLSVQASTIPSQAEKAAEETSIPQTCGSCVSYDVSVWVFTPTQPDALKNILQALNAQPTGAPADIEGQRVISSDKRTTTVDAFKQSGTLEPLSIWQAMSVYGEPVPLESVSSAGSFRAELNMDIKLPSETFAQKVQKLKEHKLLSSSDEPDLSFHRLLKFKLIAGLPGNSDGEVNNISSSGRVLLKNGSALLNISRMENHYLIWMAHVAYINF